MEKLTRWLKLKSNDLLIENINSNFKEKIRLWNFFCQLGKGFEQYLPD